MAKILTDQEMGGIIWEATHNTSVIDDADVIAFSEKVETNWGVEISYNPIKKQFVMYK